jgi:hypothetical protein
MQDTIIVQAQIEKGDNKILKELRSKEERKKTFQKMFMEATA